MQLKVKHKIYLSLHVTSRSAAEGQFMSAPQQIRSSLDASGNTAAHYGSNLLDIQSGQVDKHKLRKAGLSIKISVQGSGL